MTRTGERLLFWVPRALAALFAIFVSLFALDVFGEGYGLWETILALLIHLIPTGLIVLALALAWRWEWTGAVLFPGLGLLYLAVSRGRLPWPIYLQMAGPLFLIGGLFLAGWLYRRRLGP